MVGAPILKVKKLDNRAKLPIRAHAGDAGLDLFSIESVEVKPGEIVEVKTGIAVEIPKGYFGLIKDRSGLAAKGLHVLAGVIDEGYRGEIKVIMVNLGKKPLHIPVGSRFAQLIILPYPRNLKITEAKELTESERGEKGFGSTGL